MLNYKIPDIYFYLFCLKNNKNALGIGKMAQQLKALAALAPELNLVPSIQVAAQIYNYRSRECNAPLYPVGSCMYMVHIHTLGTKYTYKW